MAKAVHEWPEIKNPTELLIPFKPKRYKAQIFYCVDYSVTGAIDIGVGASSAAYLKASLETAGFTVNIVKDPLHDQML